MENVNVPFLALMLLISKQRTLSDFLTTEMLFSGGKSQFGGTTIAVIFFQYNLPQTVAPFTLPFKCRDPAPILLIILCVKVSDATRGEISLQLWR